MLVVLVKQDLLCLDHLLSVLVSVLHVQVLQLEDLRLSQPRVSDLRKLLLDLGQVEASLEVVEAIVVQNVVEELLEVVSLRVKQKDVVSKTSGQEDLLLEVWSQESPVLPELVNLGIKAELSETWSLISSC